MSEYNVDSHITNRISEEQAKRVVEMVVDFYKDEKNLKEFEEWKTKRNSKVK